MESKTEKLIKKMDAAKNRLLIKMDADKKQMDADKNRSLIKR